MVKGVARGFGENPEVLDLGIACKRVAVERKAKNSIHGHHAAFFSIGLSGGDHLGGEDVRCCRTATATLTN